jgi:MFS family permease
MSGTLMRNAAILWHVSLLVPEGRRALALGMVGLVRIGPVIVFSFVSGVVADAVDRRRLMLWTNLAMTLVSGTLAAITLLGFDTVGRVYLLAALSAAIGAFDNPARQSLYPSLVPPEQLPNAISLNSINRQVASVIGPMIGGLLIGRAGVGFVYLYDVASFLVLLWSLLAMRDVPRRPPHARGDLSLRAGLDGLLWVFRQPLIRSSMLLDFFATFFASATALLPLFAQDVLEVGARGYGLLVSAPAIGALVTSLAMVSVIDRVERRGRVLLHSILLYGLATAVFGLSRFFWLSFACLALSGAADMVSTVLRNVIRQVETPDALRGRMTSVNMMFFMGGPQLGELEAGLVAQAFGPAASVVSGGLGCMVAASWLAWKTPALVAYRAEAPASTGG